MNFDLTPDAEAFRSEVRAFLAEHLTDELRERVHRTGTVHDWGFHRALAARGWIGAGWPVEYGGQGRDPWQLRVFYEECALADAPTDGLPGWITLWRGWERLHTMLAYELSRATCPQL